MVSIEIKPMHSCHQVSRGGLCEQKEKPVTEDSTASDRPHGSILHSVVTLTWDDFEVGKLLGSGSFAQVYQIKPFNTSLLAQDDDMLEDAQISSERSLSTHSYSTYSSERSLPLSKANRFALKAPNKDLFDEKSDPRAAQVALIGLKFEAGLLSELPRHENVIKMFGLSSNFSDDPSKGFLVLERLTETLDARLKRWKIRKSVETDNKRHFRFFRREDPEQRYRISHIGIGIARAMKFLHQNSVLFRDLKPENLGFDHKGQVKLFDFGLARKLEDQNDSRRLTFQVGSLRYMSPECATGEVYGFSTDVYSFAIFLWEIITLETPFSKCKNWSQLSKLVFVQNKRPSLKQVDSRGIRELLKASWDPNPVLRPSFAPIVAHLRSKNISQRSCVSI